MMMENLLGFQAFHSKYPMAKQVAGSRDYMILSGSKELLDNLQYGAEHYKPWDEKTWEQNKPILEEYLDYVYKETYSKIND